MLARPVRATLSFALVSVLLFTAAPGPAAPLGPGRPAALPAPPYRGLGAWIDIYDGPAWNAPEATVRRLHANGVRTLYLQSCNDRCRKPIFRPVAMARFLRESHRRGISVVAWYLPRFEDPARDLRRSLTAIRFTSSDGERFDSFALDIEDTTVEPAAKRNARLLWLSTRIREAVGPHYDLGAITPPWFYRWGGPFPYRALAEIYDVFLPMNYFTGLADGPRAARDHTARNIQLIRQAVGDPQTPIHSIGGIADGLDAAETRAVVRAGHRHRVLGTSLYDVFTSSPENWSELRRVQFPEA